MAGGPEGRAARRAGDARRASDREALELAIIENVQREDLNAIEEASGYDRLMDELDIPKATSPG